METTQQPTAKGAPVGTADSATAYRFVSGSQEAGRGLSPEDVIHEAIKTHGHAGSPGWLIERRQAERIAVALRKAGLL